MPQPLAVTAFMASPGRFELPAPRLGGVCSIQLSYGDIFDFSWSRMERSASQDFDDLIIRRRPLYPTELRGLIQKIFNFAGLQDSNDSIFRRRSLYPAELPGHRSHTFRGTARAFSLVIAAVYCIPFCRRCQRKKGARLTPCSFSICRMRITSRRTWPSASAGADSDPWRPPRCA